MTSNPGELRSVSASKPPEHYDVAIVGARPAGAATAMLLAGQGLRVVLVDRGRYGADTLSTHALMRAGVLALHRWGLLESIRRTTPTVDRTVFHYAQDDVTVSIKPAAGVDGLYAPRRTVLDPLLVDAAIAAGVDVRFGTTVSGVIRGSSGRVVGIRTGDRNGRESQVRAAFTVGADGFRSLIARAVGAPIERRGSFASAVTYGYWNGVAAEGYEWYYRPGFTAGLIPTGDGAVCAFVGRPAAERVADPAEVTFARLLSRSAPDLGRRLEEGRRIGRYRSYAGLPGRMRRPVGEGWALVGDAGYYKDPLSAHGITDALRDAELLARALLEVFGGRPELAALGDYHAMRDRLSLALFVTSDRLASYQWDDVSVRGDLRLLSATMTDEMEALDALPPLVTPALVQRGSERARAGASRTLGSQ